MSQLIEFRIPVTSNEVTVISVNADPQKNATKQGSV